VKTQINVPVLRNLMKQMGLGSGTSALRLGLSNNAFQVVLSRGYTADEGLVARIAAGPFAAALDIDAKADAYEPLAFKEETKLLTPEEDDVEDAIEDDEDSEPEVEPEPEEVDEELNAMPEHGEEAISLEGMSVTGILRAVEEKKISAAEALAQEGSREKPRKTLIARLDELL